MSDPVLAESAYVKPHVPLSLSLTGPGADSSEALGTISTSDRTSTPGSATAAEDDRTVTMELGADLC